MELLVAGLNVVCEAPALEEGEEAALAAVAQQARHQAAGARAVVGGVVRQREGEVEVVTLDSTVQYSAAQYSEVEVVALDTASLHTGHVTQPHLSHGDDEQF